MSSTLSTKSSCPCCAISPGLFLPPSSLSSYNVGANGEGASKSNNGGSSTSIKGEDVVLLPLHTLLSRPRQALIEILKHADDGAPEQELLANRSSKGQEGQTQRNGPTRIKLVDTHGHPQLNGDLQSEYRSNYENTNDRFEKHENEDNVDVSEIEDDTLWVKKANSSLISLACAVEEDDWERTLTYAGQSSNILPALGIHPWYLHNLPDDDVEGTEEETKQERDSHRQQEERVLEQDNKDSSSTISTWLSRLETLLVQHPHALVGEIGLCKMAKNLRHHPRGKEYALEKQRHVFVQQFRLAAKLRRPVTVHCVKQHGTFLTILEDLKREVLEPFELSYTKDESARIKAIEELRNIFPPVIGMHSFTGTAHQIKQLLQFEQSLLLEDAIPKWKRKKQQQQQDQSQQVQPLFYFGFSHTINVLMCSSEKSKRQGHDAIRAVPLDRLMVESDVHAPLDVAIGTAGSIVNIADALQLPLLDVAAITTTNGLRFLERVL